jgi:acetoacetate decarboxylase
MTLFPYTTLFRSDPIWDIDTLPLTYTNSRWSAFFYRADEARLRRVLPDCLDLEDDIVEHWYVDHNNTMLGPYGEWGLTVAAAAPKCLFPHMCHDYAFRFVVARA